MVELPTNTISRISLVLIFAVCAACFNNLFNVAMMALCNFSKPSLCSIEYWMRDITSSPYTICGFISESFPVRNWTLEIRRCHRYIIFSDGRFDLNCPLAGAFADDLFVAAALLR